MHTSMQLAIGTIQCHRYLSMYMPWCYNYIRVASIYSSYTMHAAAIPVARQQQLYLYLFIYIASCSSHSNKNPTGFLIVVIFGKWHEFYQFFSIICFLWEHYLILTELSYARGTTLSMQGKGYGFDPSQHFFFCDLNSAIQFVYYKLSFHSFPDLVPMLRANFFFHLKLFFICLEFNNPSRLWAGSHMLG